MRSAPGWKATVEVESKEVWCNGKTEITEKKEFIISLTFRTTSQCSLSGYLIINGKKKRASFSNECCFKNCALSSWGQTQTHSLTLWHPWWKKQHFSKALVSSQQRSRYSELSLMQAHCSSRDCRALRPLVKAPHGKGLWQRGPCTQQVLLTLYRSCIVIICVSRSLHQALGHSCLPSWISEESSQVS